MGVENRRAQRTREIVDATRALFETRGVREAQIEDIANSVGINRAIIYRHFSTKEELFAMVLVDYLTEMEQKFRDVRNRDVSPIDELRLIGEVFFTYGMAHPAFVDCAQSLLRFRGTEIVDEISPEPLLKLGTAMNLCLDHMVDIFKRGTDEGLFSITDPRLLANVVYTQSLGFLNLVHFQKAIGEVAQGSPVMVDLPVERVMSLAIDAVIALATMPYADPS